MPFNKLTKADVDMYLYELAKNIKKDYKPPFPVEIVIVGGASILLNYGFRDTTTDIDAILSAKTVILESARKVEEKFSLPQDWINTDFTKTKSYSPALVQHSKYYKTFCHTLSVRVVEGEYLFAMKLMSGRQYKRDLSDLIGIAKEMIEKEIPLTWEKIDKAVYELYNGWENLPQQSKEITQSILDSDNLEEMYYDTIESENKSKTALLRAEKEYPNTVNENNVQQFLNHFLERE